jgi:hypothetical protein
MDLPPALVKPTVDAFTHLLHLLNRDLVHRCLATSFTSGRAWSSVTSARGHGLERRQHLLQRALVLTGERVGRSTWRDSRRSPPAPILPISAAAGPSRSRPARRSSRMRAHCRTWKPGIRAVAVCVCSESPLGHIWMKGPRSLTGPCGFPAPRLIRATTGNSPPPTTAILRARRDAALVSLLQVTGRDPGRRTMCHVALEIQGPGLVTQESSGYGPVSGPSMRHAAGARLSPVICV